MMITTWRILWIPTPGLGVSAVVVVLSVLDVLYVVLDPLVLEPAFPARFEPPPQPVRRTTVTTRAAAIIQPPSRRPQRPPVKI